MTDKEYIEEIKDWLKNLAEDSTIPMDVKVYNLLWEKIKDIQHYLREKK